MNDLARILFLSSMVGVIWTYNIEVNKVGVATGEPGSEFGFSVALAPAPGSEERYENNQILDYVLLVGSPNTTVDNIAGHGSLMRCDQPQDSETVICVDMYIKEPGNTCERVRSVSISKGHEASQCAHNQRLGTSVAVNPNFYSRRYTTSTLPLVSVCAPSWKNVYNEWREGEYQIYPIGMCLKLRERFQLLDCTSDDFTYCWPFWTSKGTAFNDGRPMNAYAQAGMSATFTKDGRSEVVGAPGRDNWKGSYSAHQINWEKDSDEDSDNNRLFTFYFGYAIAAGYFNIPNTQGRVDSRQAEIAAGIPNFYSRSYGHFGKVQLYEDNTMREQIEFGQFRNSDECSKVEMTDTSSIDKTQVGTKFGAAVAAIDVTGDGIDELLVGAPLYASKNSPEEGRVFVYRTADGSLCGPVAILSGSVKKYSRFGTSIASAGDLNGDSYKDVAIGAPYEDDQRGAIYLYHGTSKAVNEVFTQRIAGRDIHDDLRTFGWSIFGDTDVDKNLYPDLAVGAYASSHAVVLRTRPVASISASVNIMPRTIPLNASMLNCSEGGRLCITVNLTFSLEGRGIFDPLDIEVDLKTDTLLKKISGVSRVQFRDDGTDRFVRNITLLPGELHVLRKTMDVKGGEDGVIPSEIWTALAIEGHFRLIPTADRFGELDPILNSTSPSSFSDQVFFDKKCEKQEECTSDLDLQVKLILVGTGNRGVPYKAGSVLYLDETRKIQLEVDVTNLNDTSYNANFTSKADVALIGEISSNSGQVSAKCKQEQDDNPNNPVVSEFHCQANTKLDRAENIRVIASFDTSKDQLLPGTLANMQESVVISVQANQVNEDINKKNNFFNVSIPVKLKYDVEIRENKVLYAQRTYRADPKSTRELNIQHQYTLINNGPSFMPRTKVKMTVPISKDDVDFAKLGDLSATCKPVSMESIGTPTFRTTTPSTSGTTRISIATPKPQRKRRRRDTDEQPQRNETSSKHTVISCEDYVCVTIECECDELNKHQNRTFNITIKIIEKSIAVQGSREVKYGTRATVTDPYLSYGGKVVPFQSTVYAEKWTNLIVEPDSVESEINIWIIIGAIIGALALLIIVIIVLWKCGFFKRKKHDDVQKWKQESLYKRRSQAATSSTNRPTSNQPYTPIEEK